MSRDWCAPAVPAIRDGVIRTHARANHAVLTALTRHPGPDEQQARDGVAAYTQFTSLLRRAELYFVSAKMTRFAATAAAGLPPWTPVAALPAPAGLLLWGTPQPASLTWTGALDGQHRPVTWDAVAWELRPTPPPGITGQTGPWLWVEVLSRLKGLDSQISPYRRGVPLLNIKTLAMQAEEPFAPRDGGSDLADTLAAVVGATWLLMGQERIADTRVEQVARPSRGPVDPLMWRPTEAQLSEVQVVDLRRTASKPQESEKGHEGREYHRQWWVTGHWRQQACGPGRAQRKPIWIDPHVKGPEGAPLAGERVNVWRR